MSRTYPDVPDSLRTRALVAEEVNNLLESYEAPEGVSVELKAGPGVGTGNGGAMDIAAGDATNANGAGGSVTLTLGLGAGAGLGGNLLLVHLPSADPHVVGAVYVAAGTLKISAG